MPWVVAPAHSKPSPTLFPVPPPPQVRAQQAILGDGAVAGLLVHGDAAFSGLGIVAETLSLARVPGYATGGTLHIVANNQVGFTTPPAQARSGPHPTDLARAAGAAVLHVCADDPDAVAFACALAADWRAAWRSDAVVDVVGFRRHGHNELDDPESAQPVTHAAIGVHPGVVAVYADALAAAGVASRGDAERYAAAATAEYEAEHAAFARGEYAQSADDWLCSSWQARCRGGRVSVFLSPAHCAPLTPSSSFLARHRGVVATCVSFLSPVPSPSHSPPFPCSSPSPTPSPILRAGRRAGCHLGPRRPRRRAPTPDHRPIADGAALRYRSHTAATA